MPPDLDNLGEMKAAFKQAHKDGVVDGRVYRDTVLSSWGFRAIFAALGITGPHRDDVLRVLLRP